jgi:serine/threonine-protein kinase HipA
MVFNVAAANCDDHTKNVSFLLPEGGDWALSPAYDVTHAYLPGNRWIHQHLMAVNGETSDITRADVATIGDRFEVPGATRIIEAVLAVVDTWPDFAATAAVPTAMTHQISEHIAFWSGPLR